MFASGSAHAACPQWLAPCPRVVSRLWTHLGEEGVLGSPTTWHGLVGASWTISVLSEDYWPYVRNATLKMIFSKVAPTLNDLLLDTLTSSWIKKWHWRQHVLFLLRDEEAHWGLQLKMAHYKRLFLKIITSIGFPIGTWIPIHGKLPRIVCFNWEAFWLGTGHYIDLKMNWYKFFKNFVQLI